MMTPMDDSDEEQETSMVRMGVGNQESSMIGSALPNLPNWMRGSSSSSSYSVASSRSSTRRSDILSDIRNEDLGFFHDADDGSSLAEEDNRRLSARSSQTQSKNVNNSNKVQDTFLDEGVVTAYGQGHRHGAIVYDDWGLPISNPSTYREGRNLCRPWLVFLNIFAICVVIFILAHGGPDPTRGTDASKKHYNWLGKEVMEEPDTVWDFMGDELVGPIPNRHHQAENRLVGYGHHVAMNAKGDRIAIARTSGGGHSDNNDNDNDNIAPGEIYVYSWKGGLSKRRHNHPPNKNGKWRLEQILTAELEEGDSKLFPSGQQHTPLAMSASGHRIAFTEGDHVFIFESAQEGVEWEQIAKVESLNAELQEEAAHAGVSKDDATADKKDDEDDDNLAGPTRQLAGHDRKSGESHFGKHLAFSHDGKKLAVLGFNHIKGGYIRVFQDETEDINTQGLNEIRHLFEPTPDIFLEEVGDSLALSGDGTRLAIGIATSDDLQSSGTHNGMVQVFGIDGNNDEWSRIGRPIFGDYPMEGFGGTVSLSEDGMVLAAGVAYGGGPVKVFEVVELDHLGKKWQWKQMGQTLSGTSHREHYGSQVRLDHNGAFLAIGAPGSPDMLEQDEPIDEDMEQALHGKAYLLAYNRESNTWESKGEATSSYEGDAFGYSVAIDGDGDRVIVGAPFRVVDDQVNVGVVQVFGI